VAGDLFDGLGVHPQHDAVDDESLADGVVYSPMPNTIKG
jgi:hypothetical protein